MTVARIFCAQGALVSCQHLKRRRTGETSLPILIEITPGQSFIGVMAGGKSVEAKVLA